MVGRAEEVKGKVIVKECSRYYRTGMGLDGLTKFRFCSYQAHLNTCKHDAVPCGNKCGAMIPRVLMEDHLKYTCAQRRARCDFCAKEFTGHTLEVYNSDSDTRENCRDFKLSAANNDRKIIVSSPIYQFSFFPSIIFAQNNGFVIYAFLSRE